MRILQLLSLLPLLPGSWAATFTSCTDSQIAVLERAIERATEKAHIVVEYLEANPNGSDLMTTWYGAFTRERYNKILAGFKKFAPDMATLFSYDCACQSETIFASVGGTYGDVKICKIYFDETLLPPVGGHRTQWDTIIHEAAHFRASFGGTIDWGYGVDYCKDTALVDPDKAIGVADCHAVFAVEVPPFGP